MVDLHSLIAHIFNKRADVQWPSFNNWIVSLHIWTLAYWWPCTMQCGVVCYQWFWYNMTDESVLSRASNNSASGQKKNLVLPKHTQNNSWLLRSCLPCDPPLVTVIHVNEGEEKHQRTEQKFVTKHLLLCSLLSLEINGVLNKLLLLLLEQCQCQREFVVKEKLHTCPGKLPSHYCMCLTWMR